MKLVSVTELASSNGHFHMMAEYGHNILGFILLPDDGSKIYFRSVFKQCTKENLQ
jgi:hypothetical protein